MTLAAPIPHSRTVLAEGDVEAAVAVLRSGQVNDSEVTRELERGAAAALGRRHAWATASGTAALRLALVCLGVGPGDEVLLPTYVCDDVLSAVLAAGGRAVPVDLDPSDLNLDPDDAASRTSGRTRAVIAAHTLGMPARLGELGELGVPVIEDCAHGLGGTLADGPAGSAGLCSVLSFHGLKMVTAGEGGMLLSDDERVAAARRRLMRPDFAAGEHRFDSRLSNVLSAVALRQLERLERTVERRRRLAGRYAAALDDLRHACPVCLAAGDGRRSSCYRFALIGDGTLSFDEVERGFLDRGVVVRRPVKALSHRALGLDPAGFPVAEELFDRIVSLPLYPSLSEAEADAVIAAARSVLA